MPESFGTYELHQKIAQGGMAEIFLATRKGELGGFEKQVAIKRIFRHLTGREETVNMFFDEARIAATLNHPNIVQIFDLGEVDGYFYIAMELVRGTDLRRVCKRGLDRDNYLPMPLAAHVVSQTAAGLHYAHTRTDEQGNPRYIVHRDISPQNVLLSMGGHVKICDFGIAKAENRLARTRTGQFKGKLSYMSPEQFNGEEVDARSDIFNLGIVLYETTLARRLFDAKTDFERMRQIANAHVTPPSEVDPEYPPGLEQIIMKALRHDPADRYQTAEAMQLEIEDWLHECDAKVGAVQVGNYMEQVFPELVDGIPEDMAQVEFPSTGRGSAVEELGEEPGHGATGEPSADRDASDSRGPRGSEQASSDELAPGDKTEQVRPEELLSGGNEEPTVDVTATAEEVREEHERLKEEASPEDDGRTTSGSFGSVTVDPSKQSSSPSEEEEESVVPTKKIAVDRREIAEADDPADLGLDSENDTTSGATSTARDGADPEAPTKPRERDVPASRSEDSAPPAEGRTERVDIPSKQHPSQRGPPSESDASQSSPMQTNDGDGAGASDSGPQGPPTGRGSGPSGGASGGPMGDDAALPPEPGYGQGDTEPENEPGPDDFDVEGTGGLERRSSLRRQWDQLVGVLTDSDESITNRRGRLIALGILVAGVIGAGIYVYTALVHSPDLSEMKKKMKRRKQIAAAAADAAGEGAERPDIPRVSAEIRTEPKGAFVVANGQPVDERTPAEVQLVEGERNELYLYKSKHAPRRVLIEADGSDLPVFELESVDASKTGPVRITSEPTGAEAFLDGTRVGRTPITAEEVARSGRHFLRLRQKGRHPVFALFEMRDEGETVISARLSISKGPEDDDYCEVVYDIVPQGSMLRVNGEVQGTSVTSVRHTCGNYLEVKSWRSNYEDGQHFLFLDKPGKYLLRTGLEKIVRKKGEISLDAPDDLKVFIGANSYGKGTIESLELPEGEYTAVFQPAGSDDRYEKTLKVVPETTTKYRVRLEGGSATLERVAQ